MGPVDGLLKVKHPLKIPFTSAASRLPLCVCFFGSRKVTTRYDGRNPAGCMASSNRMRLGRRRKDDDPHKKMCPDGVRNGCLQIRCWAPIRPILGLYGRHNAAVLLIPEFCPGGQRQRLTVNNSILLVENDSKKASKPIESPHSMPGPCI